jgi:hypothetical protein
MSDLIIRLHMIERLRAENAELQARVEALEYAIKDTISNFYTDKPPYYQVHHEVGDMLEQVLEATEHKREGIL